MQFRDSGKQRTARNHERMKNMSTKLLLIFALLMTFASFSFAAANQQSGVITVSSTPTQFSTTLGQVQRLTFRVIPGYCGKIYVGNSSMNTSTLAGVFKVLYPNCYGGLSDEYVLEDRTATDGINAAIFYIAGDISGEKILWEGNQTGVTAATNLVPFLVGPFKNQTGMWAAYAAQFGTSSQFAALVQVNVVPGQSGKVEMGNVGIAGSAQPDSSLQGLRKMLYPNDGSMNITDSYEDYSPDGSNALLLTRYAVWSTVSTEFPTVAVWQRQ